MDFSALLAMQAKPQPQSTSNVDSTASKTATSSVSSTSNTKSTTNGASDSTSYGAVMKEMLQQANAVTSNLETSDSLTVVDQQIFSQFLTELQVLLEEFANLSKEGTNTEYLEVEALLGKLNALLNQFLQNIVAPENNTNIAQEGSINITDAHLWSFQVNQDVEQKIETLLNSLSKGQRNDFMKLMAQLQQVLSTQEDLSKLDPKLLSILNKVNELKLGSHQVQTQTNTNVQQAQAAETKSFATQLNAATNTNTNANTEDGSTEGKSQTQESSKQQPFLLRTDTTKVIWQSEMSRVQQLSLNAEMKGSQINAESFMKGFDKLLSSSAFLKNGGLSKLVIKLHPEHLGTIRIELVQSQTSLVAKLHVQNEQVRSLIESQLQGLKTSFAAQNVQVDKFEISSNIDYERFQKQSSMNQFQNQSNKEDQSDQPEHSNEDGSESDTEFISFK